MCETGRDSGSRMQIYGIDNNSEMIKSYNSQTDTNSREQGSLKKKKFDSKVQATDENESDEEKRDQMIRMENSSPQSIITAMNVLQKQMSTFNSEIEQEL